MTAEDTIASEVRTFVLENLHSYTCKRDVDKVLADFASNIFFIPIGQTQSIRGLEELEPWLRHEFEQHPDPVDTEQLWEHVDVLGPALAVVNTATRLHFSKTVVMELRCTFVCEKQPDVGWQIVNLHGALPAQPPAEGELWSVDKLRARNEQLEREVAERTEQLARQKTELERAYREAQIEAALERVRARSMVMHQSNELSEVIAVVFNEMEGLGFAPSVCSIGIFDAATRASVWWMSDETGADFPDRYHVPDLDHPWYTGIFEAWQRREPSYVFELSGESKKRLGDLLFKESDFKDLPEASIEAMRAPERVIMHYASMNHGLVEVVTEEALPDNKVAILQRVASVIDLAYTRFDDLQQAEAQAREAQIEAALERVRSRTMGMQRSDELGETASILFQQIRDLGVQIWSSGFQIWNADGISTTAWMASPEGGHQPSWNLPHTGDCFHRQILEARQRGEDFFVFESEGTSLEEVYRYMMTLPSIREFFNDALKAGFTLPTFQITHCGFFSHGYLMFITLEPHPEAWDIFRRFTRVFEQTYTRFLDLKQAEEQARESEIQLALERVRSRAMAMHRSDELPEAAGLLYKELMTLGITPVASGYVFLDEESEQGLVLAVDTFEDGTSHLSSWHVPSTEDPVLRHRYESWKRQEPLLRVELEGDPSIAHNRYIASFTPEIPEEVYENLPERLIYYTANFSHGYLFVITTEPIAVEEEKTLVRFAKVFEMTYRRFLDLQQAEARARDAEQQASIDRVRAEIASMRTAEDLDRITPLVWRELTTLNVPFFRCGVFIMDEAEEVVTAYLSTPEGGALARLRLPFDITEAIQETVAHWQRKQVFLDQWSREEFIGFMHTMMDQGILDASSDYRELNIPQGQLTLQFVPFAQGMLYIGSDDPLSDDQIDLAQALADAFAVAYARYEDFQRLEIAKAEVEVALQHLKATQAQLVQSEKLASLGQLTAGIAHEIKNPLNFINNFAELVGELTEELEEEIESTQDTNGTDNTDQFKEILSDLKMNAKIIAQHGRRADGIVSAMVQHASGGTGKREPTDINELLEEYVNLAYHGKRAQVTGFNCEIIRDYDKAVGAVELVPQEIGRVFINLLGNAFDAVSLQNTDDTVEPKVYVSTEREEDKVRIHVQDNGPGIPAEYIEKIFEPFFTTKPTGSGTGLGLSMSYDIITQGHSGTLSVESKPGGGARFTITLPGSGSGHNNPASTRSESVYAPPHIPRGKTIGKL